MMVQRELGSDHSTRPWPGGPGCHRPGGCGFYPWAVPDAGELLIVSNPDQESRLGYLLRLPIGGGLAVRTPGAWALPCGDYGVVADGRLVAAVERKSLPDLVSSVTNGKLRYALGDLAALPRAAVVVEDRYSALFKQRHARPAAVADALAEYQIRWPTIPIVFCETRPLAEEWTYRYLAAAWQWATTEPAAQERTTTTDSQLLGAPERPEPTVAEVRAWARSAGFDV